MVPSFPDSTESSSAPITLFFFSLHSPCKPPIARRAVKQKIRPESLCIVTHSPSLPFHSPYSFLPFKRRVVMSADSTNFSRSFGQLYIVSAYAADARLGMPFFDSHPDHDYIRRVASTPLSKASNGLWNFGFMSSVEELPIQSKV